MIAERAAFASDASHLSTFAQCLKDVRNLGANDIYNWYLASSGSNAVRTSTNFGDGTTADGSKHAVTTQPPDLKINLIYPCTDKHIAKYSSQGVRIVNETPEIYRDHIRPYMQKNRDEGRLNWVFNIIEGRTEQEDVIFRKHSNNNASQDDDQGFLVLPDLNWDRKTISSLHLLGLVDRKDIWSVRDLRRKHIPWLKDMRQKLVDATTQLYPQIEEDQLKLYVHYQPTYYHFHIHVVHVMLEAGATQAVGKALSLENVIGQLEGMDGEEAGMADVSLTYSVGEASDLWLQIFEPLKKERLKGTSDGNEI